MRVPPQVPQYEQFAWQISPGDLRRWREPPFREFERLANDQYLHWEKVRHRPPAGMTAAEAWRMVAHSRAFSFTPLPLTAGDGAFKSWTPPRLQRWLHRIDQNTAGLLGSDENRVLSDSRAKFLINSRMEEAIASSQLEGASTTRKVAKRMLREGREPRNRHERMIVNNDRGMKAIKERFLHRPLTPAMMQELHRIVTDGALDVAGAEGRWRRPEDGDIVVATDEEIHHRPPPCGEIQQRVEQLCAFVNRSEDDGPFLHPVLKALTLHFMVGYIHPFADGNGRTARALFYWHLLCQDDWLFEFLTISARIKDSKVSYGRAYLHVESDGHDLTYFFHYNLRQIDLAIDAFAAYLARERQRTLEIDERLPDLPELNFRQRDLLRRALRDGDLALDVTEHEVVHNVSKNTARSDLTGLVEAGLFRVRKDGRKQVFRPAADLLGRIGPPEASASRG